MKILARAIAPLVALLLGASGARGGDGPSTVTLTLTGGDHGGGRIYLPVRFGNFAGTMRLDTGASTTRITLAPWNKDLPSLGESHSTGASGQTMRCEDVEARNVQLQAAQGNNIARAKYVVSRCPAGAGEDLLGLDFFKGARFTLDFDRREMAFFAEAPALGRARPFRRIGPDRRLVGLDLRLGRTTAVGLFDTGAELSAVDQRFVQKHKNLFTPVRNRPKVSEAGGKRFAPSLYRIRKLDLGDGRILRDVHALVYDFGVLREALGRRTPFILGYDLVSRLNWDLDFRAPDAPTWAARPR